MIVKEGLNKVKGLTHMRKEPIINFDGLQFTSDRRANLLRSRGGWQVRRQVRNKIGVARNLRNVLAHLFGF